MFTTRILYIFIVLFGFSQTASASIDELNPVIHCAYQPNKIIESEQPDIIPGNQNACNYRSQSWGMHLLTSCTEVVTKQGKTVQKLAYLISYPNVLPEYLDGGIYKKMTLLQISNFKFFYYSYNDNNHKLFSLYLSYLNNLMIYAMDTFEVKYQVDGNFNRYSLEDAAQQIFNFRQTRVSSSNPTTVKYPINPEYYNTKSIIDLAKFIKEKNYAFYIDDNIDNDDVGKFNRFWKNLNINMSSGKSAFARPMSSDQIHAQLEKMYQQSKLHATSFQDVIYEPEKITKDANKLLSQIFAENTVTAGRQALNDINNLDPFNILAVKLVADLELVPAHIWQQWDGIICVTCAEQHTNDKLLNTIKAYQQNHPAGQVFWLGQKFTVIPPKIITRNFYTVPGNPQKILPKLHDALAQLHAIPNTQVADNS